MMADFFFLIKNNEARRKWQFLKGWRKELSTYSVSSKNTFGQWKGNQDFFKWWETKSLLTKTYLKEWLR